MGTSLQETSLKMICRKVYHFNRFMLKILKLLRNYCYESFNGVVVSRFKPGIHGPDRISWSVRTNFSVRGSLIQASAPVLNSNFFKLIDQYFQPDYFKDGNTNLTMGNEYKLDLEKIYGMLDYTTSIC